MDPTESGTEPEPRLVTANQIVAWNVGWYRRAAGMTQQQLGDWLGWTARAVSEAERTWESGRTREWDAQLLTEIAIAIGIPLLALFIPPDDAECQIPYPGGEDERLDMEGLMRLALPDNDLDSPVMAAYRVRLLAAVTRHVDKDWAREVARWLEKIESPEARADRRQRLLARAAELEDVKRELLGLADALGEEES